MTLPTTVFKSPTVVEARAWDGGSGSVTGASNILSGGVATFSLPNGATYTPSSSETSAGHLLPATVNQKGYGFSSVLPANSVVTGVSIKVKLYSENTEEDDLLNAYQLVFSRYLDVVINASDPYLLFQPKSVSAPLNDQTLQTYGSSSDIWQPSPRLEIDGMYMYSLDGSSYGYEVQTSMQPPNGYDFFFTGHTLLIQPTTKDNNTATLDTTGCLTNYLGLVGKTITLSVPGVGDFTLTGTASATSPGDAFFRCEVDENTTVANISNQFLEYSTGLGAVSDYISITFFTDVIWQWMPAVDTGAATNLYRVLTNADASAFFLPNSGYFTGGQDPDPTQSTMVNAIAAPLINTVSGAPIYARSNSSGFNLTITNSVTNFSMATNIPASYFRDSNFGISAFFDWNTRGDVFAYPESPDNTQKLGIITIALTYQLVAAGGVGDKEGLWWSNGSCWWSD